MADKTPETDPRLKTQAQGFGTCPTCGQTLTQTGPNGECLRCVMNWAFTAEENFADALRYGHFEVELDKDGLPITVGAGAMAMTYRARDTVLNSLVALKVIGRNLAKNSIARARFLREARAAAQIHHPNVARVIHYGEQNGECFYAMELVQGETLEARVQRGGPLPVSQALEVIEQATRALLAAEKCGVVHRDIKPSNMMIESDPSGAVSVKIIDYGVAKVLAAEVSPLEQTQTGFIGTPAFASPEQFGESAKSEVDVRADIYSLGTTFWYLLTGQAPFGTRSLEEIRAAHHRLPIEQLRAAHVPGAVVELLKRMMAIDPTNRPQNARDLLEEIHRVYLRFEPRARLRRKRTWLGVAAATIVVALGIAGYHFYQRGHAPAATEERSIAVLPFANLSSDPDNAYFADGIQDEILTRLSKIADLKVISRASTQRYKSTPTNLPEIAKQLGVANILEGSVQKSGETVRVNVQLIRASDDSHLWADIFDRRLTDIFSVESEVSKAIADQLRVKLAGREGQAIEAKPTNIPEAYDAYLRGVALSLKVGFTQANFFSARNYLKEAVRLDPKFALAWARLSYIDSRNYRAVPTVSLREEAREAADTALVLQPNLGEAVHAKGYYYYSCLRDYDTAARYFEQARSLLPNSAQIPESLAYLERRRGHWNRSESHFAEAERLDPRNVVLLTQHAASLIDLRRFPEAWKKLDQVLNITPDDIFPLSLKGAVAQAEGDLPRAAALLAPLHPDANNIVAIETQVYQAILERNPASIIPRLKELVAKPKPESAVSYQTSDLRFWLGWAQEVAGEHAAAQESWRQARSELESYLKEEPENWQLMVDLALTNMGLGDKSAALALVDRAVAAVPIEKDAMDGPALIEILARICAQMGDPDRAISALAKALSFAHEGALAVPPLTPALLRLDPMFDPLRNDPRFQALLNNPPPSRH